MEKVLENIKGTIHFVGIGGIGMSGLAQFYRWAGFKVSGSDRALNNPENAELFAKLKKQGIEIFPQDGSFAVNRQTDVMVYSTAIEKDNPDFVAGKEIEKWHRAKALANIVDFLKNRTSIAVTGSCGKTTVTAWLAEAMVLLGLDPIALNGGMINAFRDETYTGNFRPGKGNFFVYEADESDKSLVAFRPDYSLVLNIGIDHYSTEELVEVFETFLKNTKKGAVIEKAVFGMLNPDSYRHLNVSIVSSEEKDLREEGKIWKLDSYKTGERQTAACSYAGENFSITLPMPGCHSAANALAVTALLKLLDEEKPVRDIVKAVEQFKGVHRRFEYKGKTTSGASVIDDYAHNVEKIVSCIKTGQEISNGKVFAVFQPHGYGPFKFMREDLFPELEKALRKDDKFILLPVFYAGGTSSFSPKSSEVNDEYSQKSKTHDRYLYFDNRQLAESFLLKKAEKKDLIIVMGARDSSLAIWAGELTNHLGVSRNV